MRVRQSLKREKKADQFPRQQGRSGSEKYSNSQRTVGKRREKTLKELEHLTTGKEGVKDEK